MIALSDMPSDELCLLQAFAEIREDKSAHGFTDTPEFAARPRGCVPLPADIAARAGAAASRYPNRRPARSGRAVKRARARQSEQRSRRQIRRSGAPRG